MQIARLRERRNILEKQLLTVFENTGQKDKYINVLEASSSIQSKRRLTEMALRQGDYGKVQQTLNKLKQMTQADQFMSKPEKRDVQSFVQFMETLNKAQSKGRTLAELTDGELSVLESIAKDSLPVSADVQNLLAQVKGMEFENKIKKERLTSGSRSLNREVVSGMEETRRSDQMLLKVYPNPAKDKLNIQLTGSLQKDGKFTVFSLLGNKIIQENFETGETLKQVSTESMSCGVYLYEFRTREGVLKRGKITLIK